MKPLHLLTDLNQLAFVLLGGPRTCSQPSLYLVRFFETDDPSVPPETHACMNSGHFLQTLGLSLSSNPRWFYVTHVLQGACHPSSFQIPMGRRHEAMLGELAEGGAQEECTSCVSQEPSKRASL